MKVVQQILRLQCDTRLAHVLIDALGPLVSEGKLPVDDLITIVRGAIKFTSFQITPSRGQ